MTDTRRSQWTFTEPRVVDCCKDDTQIGVLQCRGCGLIFCTVHATEHRETLHGRRDILERAFYEWKSNRTNGFDTSSKELVDQRQSLMDEIDRWEVTSIEKIRNAALSARQHLEQLFTFETVSTSEKSVEKTLWLEQRLKEARDYENFHEAHLKRWEVALECLRGNASNLLSVNAELRETDLLVRNIIVEGKQISKQVNQPVKPVAVKFPRQVNLSLELGDNNCATNQCELESGVHEFHIKSKFVSFGIGPKNPRQRREPASGAVEYGWIADSNIYIDGQFGPNYEPSDRPSVNDEFIITVDCDQHIIFLLNLRTGEERQIDVDIQQCPLPWQLCIQFAENVQQ